MATMSDFHELSDALRERCREIRRAAPGLLRADGDGPRADVASLDRASAVLAATLAQLDAAADELRARQDELFAARTEMDAQGQFYRELFDLAPAVCLVTTPEARITHVNVAATSLFGRPVNALVGRPLEGFVDGHERAAFRAAVARARAARSVEEWPILLLCRGPAPLDCRVRVSARRDGARVRSLQWIVTEDAGSGGDLL